MKKFAVFDIDGTLIRWQLYHAIVDKLAQQDLLNEDSLRVIHEARMRWKNRENNYSFAKYESAVVNQFETSIKQLKPEDFNKALEEVMKEYKDQVYTFTRNLMRKLKSDGYILLAISGSHQELVQKLSEYYGFDDSVGTTYSTDDSGYTGEKIFVAHNKQEALDRFIKKHNLNLNGSYAVGDSKGDASMLEVVENPIAFNPDSQLYEIAKEKHWPIVIERKNVTYRLEYKDGSYILAKAS